MVLGAGGFVGRHLCDRLRADGWDVVGTVRPGLLGGVPVDLADLEALTRAVRAADPDIAFHLAAGRARATAAERAATASVNARSGLHLVEALGPRCRAVVRLGSSTEYATVDGPMDETAPLTPRPVRRDAREAVRVLLDAAGCGSPCGPWSGRLAPARACLTDHLRPQKMSEARSRPPS
jgi:nucleoside-diphosphate-sugar epimerase